MTACASGRRFGTQADAEQAKPGARTWEHDDHWHARKPLSTTTQPRHRSKKTEARYVIRRQIVTEMFAEPEICEVPWCTQVATDPHEPLTRARGGDILDRPNIRKVCHPHNVMFSADEQPWMYELGFLIHSWDRRPAPSA